MEFGFWVVEKWAHGFWGILGHWIARSHDHKPRCRCGAVKEDIQHVFNSCKDHDKIREDYEEAIQKVARQDGETQEQMLKVLESKTFQNCGIAPECEKLIRWQDAKKDEEKDARALPPLEVIAADQRSGEWWSEDWLRIFTDGGVDNPDDQRIAAGGCGIYFGQDHPLNTATVVEGRSLDSYRAELQAVRLTLSGCREWSTMIWITLDNSAVVGDINKCIQNKGKMQKQDNKDIWEAINPLVEQRATKLRVTWTKGHATEEDMEKGRTSPEEKERNIAADELATKGIAMNEMDAIMIKAAKQRKIMTALQQTKLVKIWINRQDLAAMDEAEKLQLDEEAAAIAEMQKAFELKESPTEPQPEVEEKESVDKEGRRPWQFVKIKVPTYQWELGEGEKCEALKPDTMPANLKEGQQSWWYDKPSGGNNRIRIDFPLHLWGEVGNWWSQLKWGERNAGLLKGVTWLELLVDFEIASGINCKRPQGEAAWGARAGLLRGIVKLILKVRGPGTGAMEKFFGTSKRITALAPFGAKFLPGLLRKPVFVAGEATVKAVAVNAWQWAENNKTKNLQQHEISYRNFKRGDFKEKGVKEKLEKEAEKMLRK